jgi:hypothetical protein
MPETIEVDATFPANSLSLLMPPVMLDTATDESMNSLVRFIRPLVDEAAIKAPTSLLNLDMAPVVEEAEAEAPTSSRIRLIPELTNEIAEDDPTNSRSRFNKLDELVKPVEEAEISRSLLAVPVVDDAEAEEPIYSLILRIPATVVVETSLAPTRPRSLFRIPETADMAAEIAARS